MWKFVLLLLLAGIVGGGVYLATWDMPPPSERMEKVVPNDRFNRN
jgi:hypothetical protein